MLPFILPRGHSLWPVMQLQGTSHPLTQGVGGPLLASASRGKVPNAFRTASAANLECAECRVKVRIGGANLSELRVVYCGYYIRDNVGDETNAGNSQQLEVALEIGGTTVQFAFGGSLVGTIANGAAEYVSDPIYPGQFGLSVFAAGASYYLRSRTVVTSGQNIVRTVGALTSDGESGQYSDGLSASQLLGTGALTTPAGGVGIGADVLPAVVLGRAVGAREIAVLGIGDSIAEGNAETATAGAGANDSGFISRGLFSVNSRIVPISKMTCGGTTAKAFVDGYTKRSALFKYFTHAICNFGTNDSVSLSRSSAQVLADLKTIWAALRAGGIRHVTEIGIIPRTTSTDSFATVVNQTPRTGFATGGVFRDALNAALLANVGADGLDEFIDISAHCADGTALDKWAVPGKTTDGIHPSAAAHTAAAADITTAAGSWVY